MGSEVLPLIPIRDDEDLDGFFIYCEKKNWLATIQVVLDRKSIENMNSFWDTPFEVIESNPNDDLTSRHGHNGKLETIRAPISNLKNPQQTSSRSSYSKQ